MPIPILSVLATSNFGGPQALKKRGESMESIRSNSQLFEKNRFMPNSWLELTVNHYKCCIALLINRTALDFGDKRQGAQYSVHRKSWFRNEPGLYGSTDHTRFERAFKCLNVRSGIYFKWIDDESELWNETQKLK